MAHMLEERGLPTVVLASALPQVEKTRPPRALMAPFILGRPLGEPGDSDFQRRVLLQALALLERTDGPVILEHFVDDNPSHFDRPGWEPSVVVPPPGTYEDAADWESAFRDEMELVMPAWERFESRFGRTTVGLSGQSLQDWPDFAAAVLRGELPTAAPFETTALSMRFLCDDIKAFYGEAAQADGPAPSAGQIDRWFWRETVAGQMLIALRSKAMESPNNALKTVGGRFFVPTPYLPAG
jgi:hypothetical protein